MNQNNSQITALDAVVLVQVDIRASDLSGKVERIRDLPTENMPPANLVSAGVRHFCDPSLKTVFNTIRKAAERACAEVGIPLLKGWAIPKDKAAKLDDTLRKLAVDFNIKADDLVRRLPTAYTEWEEANPGWEDLLRRDRPDPKDVRPRYRFRHVLYRMRPAADDIDDPLNEGLGITRGSLLEAILDDVAGKSGEVLEKHFAGKAQVNGRVMTTIGVLANKLRSFAMVDPLVIPVASMIGDVLAQIGQTNAMLGVSETSALRGLLSVMTDPVTLRRHGALHNEGVRMEVEEVQAEPAKVINLENVVAKPPIPVPPRAATAVLM